MVPLPEASSSNGRIAAAYPNGLVAVFVGGTSGVGEYAVRALVKYTPNSRVYLVGRSQEAATRIIDDCHQTDPSVRLEFIQADTAQLKVVDNVYRQIREQETRINLLFQSQGSMGFDKKTPDGLNLASALYLHSHIRFVQNLLRVVPTGISRDASGLSLRLALAVSRLLGPLIYTSPHDCGEMHLFFATSAQFAPARAESAAEGVPVSGTTVASVATSVNGHVGGGVYSVDNKGAPASVAVEKLVHEFHDDGTADKVWQLVSSEFQEDRRRRGGLAVQTMLVCPSLG